MLGNYLKVALRNLLRHKGYSLINIAGLAAGMTSFLLISLWILNELSYDRFHHNVDNIFMVLTQGTQRDNPATPAPLAPALAEQFPEILGATRYEWFGGTLVSRAGAEYYEYGIRSVDSSFFRIFTFPFVRGEATTAFADPHSVVITEETAVKYFGDADPLGQMLTMDHRRQFTVTGVVGDVPPNSDLQFDMLVPFTVHMQVAKERTGWDMGWGWFSPHTFITLRDNTSPAAFESRITDFFKVRVEDEESGLSIMPFVRHHFFLSGTEQYIYIFLAVAFLILGMACINFVNLTTAYSIQRARETGIRKVVGAGRRHIMLQFLGEAVLLALAALGIAVILVELVLPGLNALLGIQVSFNVAHNHYLLPALIGFAIFIGLVAGIYPAVLISRVEPVRILNRHRKFSAGPFTLRRILIVVQFSCSIFLVIATGVMYHQLNFMTDAAAGYEKDHVINLPLRGDGAARYGLLRTELLRTDGVVNVSGCAAEFPYWRWSTDAISWEGIDPDQEVQIGMNYVDYDLIETLKIEMIAGRSFSRDHPSDTSSAFLINEEMALLMGGESVVGADLTYAEQRGEVIGIMKNFHFKPLTDWIGPLVLVVKPEAVRTLSLRISPEHTAATLAAIEGVWERIVPDYPFDYRFLDEVFAARYRGVARIAGLAGCFALVAIMIACLGLLGLASFAAQLRTKEIGIRKVLGASVFGISELLGLEYIFLVAAANVVAWPVAYYAANRWLENFAYRTEVGFGTFALSGIVALVLALSTVSFHTAKAALANPVHSLRHE